MQAFLLIQAEFELIELCGAWHPFNCWEAKDLCEQLLVQLPCLKLSMRPDLFHLKFLSAKNFLLSIYGLISEHGTKFELKRSSECTYPTKLRDRLR